jgi:hypothetical protein
VFVNHIVRTQGSSNQIFSGAASCSHAPPQLDACNYRQEKQAGLLSYSQHGIPSLPSTHLQKFSQLVLALVLLLVLPRHCLDRQHAPAAAPQRQAQRAPARQAIAHSGVVSASACAAERYADTLGDACVAASGLLPHVVVDTLTCRPP